MGVIGHNGAGKSTLLKILSRVTEPTRGEATIRGRVGALLEVGTGFHPELTGRENVFLNGAILGMPRQEIQRKFDEIVAFAEMETFIDTPIKRYSSGMQLRLAFAVAAHLEAEIMLVDEVLAVGDFGFQRRCLGKMQEQTVGEGRTVVFVSHNLGAIKALTTRCIWVDQGKIRAIGPTDEVFQEYVASYRQRGGGLVDLRNPELRPGTKTLAGEAKFCSLELLDTEGRATDTHFASKSLTARIRFAVSESASRDDLDIAVRVSTLEGVHLFSASSGPRPVEPGLNETALALTPNPLDVGTYSIELYAMTLSERIGDKAQDLVPSAMTFTVADQPRTEAGLEYVSTERRGLMRVSALWDDALVIERGADIEPAINE